MNASIPDLAATKNERGKSNRLFLFIIIIIIIIIKIFNGKRRRRRE
jgi:hypothetical protein